jgi:death-on-curing family protein
VDFFREIGQGIGGVGPKSIDLLHFALSRQFSEYDGKSRWTDRVDICATLMYGLIMNHPFHDANKRTAFLTSILHLQKIGRTPTVGGDVYEDFTVDVADNNLKKISYYKEFNIPSPDKEIMTMARFLRKDTRGIELKNKLITYRELDSLLHQRGMRLENPKNNKIDIIKFRNVDNKEELSKTVRIGTIGFPGMSKQVSFQTIDRVRNMCELDIHHGYDSQSFFNGMEDPLSLIKKYKEPLRRLAFR